MQISRVITVNWGQLPVRQYEFGEVTLLAGITGSGKSTLEDGIQAVMTAAKRGLFQFNPGQEESTQGGRKGKMPRTMASYVLGGESNGRYARPEGCAGYVVVVFRESKGEKPAVCAGVIAASAFLRKGGKNKGGADTRVAEIDTIKLLTLEGIEPLVEDFCAVEPGGFVRVCPVDEIYERLRKRYSQHSVTDHRESRKNYLSKLWGTLRGRTGVNMDEAHRAASTFSRAIAYKPVENIDDFVKYDILDDIEFRGEVRALAEGIAEIRKLREDSERIRTNVERLKRIDNFGDNLRKGWVNLQEAELFGALRNEFTTSTQLKSLGSQIRELQQQSQQHEQRKDEIEHRFPMIEDEVRDLDQIRSQHEGLVRRDTYEKQIEQAKQQYHQNGTLLRQAVGGAIASIQALKQILTTRQQVKQEARVAAALRTLPDLHEMLCAYPMVDIQAELFTIARTGLEDAGLGNTLSAFKHSTQGLDDTLALLKEEIARRDTGLLDVARERTWTLRREEKAALEEKAKIETEIAELSDFERVPYPATVRHALRLLNENLPEAKARVLCDLVEVRHPEWQSAIEAYLGNARYSVIVQPETEARAIRIAKPSGAKVVQGNLACKDAAAGSLSPNSITNEMQVDDPIARGFLRAQFGSVVMVGDETALRTTRRGLMKEGLGSGGYAMFRCEMPDELLVFGRGGRQRRLDALLKKRAQIDVSIRDIESARSDMQALFAQAEAIAAPNTAIALSAMLRAVEEIRNRQQLIDQLDLSAVADLEVRYQALKAEQVRLTAEMRDIIREEGGNVLRLKQLNDEHHREQRRLETIKDAVLDAQDQVEKAGTHLENYQSADVVRQLELQAKAGDPTDNTVNELMKGARGAIDSALGLFRKHVVEYNFEAGEFQQIKMQSTLEIGRVEDWQMFFAFLEAHQQVRLQIARQRDHQLATITDQLVRYQNEVSNALASSFCHVIHNNIQQGEMQLKTLNDLLRRHRFTEETYEFFWDWRKDMYEYYKLFLALVELPEGVNIFAKDALSLEHEAIRDELMELLLDRENNAKARAKLDEISDYRNYKNYDVKRDTPDGFVFLSEFGTGSGGQLETPSYVLRSVAISSAYRLTVPDSHHMRTMVLDEAFGKVDEARAIEVIDMLTKTMGFQVIFAMPTKNAGSLHPLLNAKYTFSKNASSRMIGELRTIINVEGEFPNRDATRELWDMRKREVAEQATLDFIALEQSEARAGDPA